MRARRASVAAAVHRAPDSLVPAALRKTRIVLDLETDLAELLDWGAKKMGYVDLADYTRDLLTEEANMIQDRVRTVGRVGWRGDT